MWVVLMACGGAVAKAPVDHACAGFDRAVADGVPPGRLLQTAALYAVEAGGDEVEAATLRWGPMAHAELAAEIRRDGDPKACAGLIAHLEGLPARPTVPEPVKTEPPGAMSTCDKAAACCADIPAADAASKAACSDFVEAAVRLGVEDQCQVALDGYRAACWK